MILCSVVDHIRKHGDGVACASSPRIKSMAFRGSQHLLSMSQDSAFVHIADEALNPRLTLMLQLEKISVVLWRSYTFAHLLARYCHQKR